VQPATEPNALFIATARVHTKNQTRGICDGNDAETELCTAGCKYGNFTPNGMTTGNCGSKGTYCEVQAWYGAAIHPSLFHNTDGEYGDICG
jgi:hypothetical protein